MYAFKLKIFKFYFSVVIKIKYLQRLRQEIIYLLTMKITKILIN